MSFSDAQGVDEVPAAGGYPGGPGGGAGPDATVQKGVRENLDTSRHSCFPSPLLWRMLICECMHVIYVNVNLIV